MADSISYSVTQHDVVAVLTACSGQQSSCSSDDRFHHPGLIYLNGILHHEIVERLKVSDVEKAAVILLGAFNVLA